MLLSVFSFSLPVHAALTIAVASNFKVSASDIAEQFKDKYAIEVSLSSASTATLYQQILRGAPFDLFLSADQEHVDLLKKANKTANQDDFIYAQGRLVFWQPDAIHTPTEQDFIAYNGRLAIANPKFAPYGIAAQQALEFHNKWQAQPYIQGNNINQAYQFVASKNVAAGLVSYAAVVQENQRHYLLIPRDWHQPIIQSGIVLNRQKIEEANLFRDFLMSPEIQKQIQAQGYN
jgi:molybdate transport system substrate-binding protein